MCLSAGKSVGEIAWRSCEGIGSRGHVVGWLEKRRLDTSEILQEFKVEQKVSVAAFTSRAEKWVGKGREEDTTEERCEGERE